MSEGCGVFKFLRYLVDGKIFDAFSEWNGFVKFLRRSDDLTGLRLSEFVKVSFLI